MSNMAVIRLLPNVAVQDGLGTGQANLVTPDPKEVWTVPATSNSLRLDLGQATYIDTFVLRGWFPVGWSYQVSASLAGDGTGQVGVVDPRLVPMGSGTSASNDAVLLTAPGVYRYLYLVVLPRYGTEGGASAKVGIGQAGVSLSPTFGHEWGSGRPIIDTGSRERLIGGGFGLQLGARKSGYNWTFGDLTDAEQRRLFDLLRNNIGETTPIAIVENFDPPARATIVAGPNTSVVNGTITKTGGIGAFDASASSDIGFRDRALAACVANAGAQVRTFGLARDPSVNQSEADIDYGVRLQGNLLQAYAYERGTVIALGTYAAGQVVAVAYDAGVITYSVDHVARRTVVAGTGRMLSFDSSFNDVGGSLDNCILAGPDGFSEGVHYGVLNRIEAYERVTIGATRWALSMEEWV